MPCYGYDNAIQQQGEVSAEVLNPETKPLQHSDELYSKVVKVTVGVADNDNHDSRLQLQHRLLNPRALDLA